MENISNLSNNLPPTTPVNDATLNQIQSDLTSEFKNAAKSVASLYKLSLQRNSVLKHQGYLDAVNDLINVIKNGGDVENWALTKKLELEGTLSTQDEREAEIHTQSHTPSAMMKGMDTIPEDYKFTMSSPIQHTFPPTMPILSMNQGLKKERSSRTLPLKKHQQPQKMNDTSSDDEYLFEEGSLKRRVEDHRLEKRPKY